MDSNYSYELVASNNRIATVPSDGVHTTPTSQTEGNIPPIDITSYKSIIISTDTGYEFGFRLYNEDGTITSSTTYSSWQTSAVYVTENIYKYMTIVVRNANNTTITKQEYSHCHILGIK